MFKTLPGILGWSAILLTSQVTAVSGQVTAAAQSSYTPHLTFDVASVREAREGNMSYIDNMPRNSAYVAERVSPWGLILGAYDVHIPQLLKNMPDWAMTTRFDISAKSDAGTDEILAKLSESDALAEKRHMLRMLLADRFHLQIHSETRVQTTYELVATPQSAKLMTPVSGDVAKTVGTCSQNFSENGISVNSKGCPFSIFFSTLQQQLGTEVVDHTGMAGMYAYQLRWNPRPVTTQDDGDRYPNILDAVRSQLGLELKKTKAPVTIWVIDHIEPPTPN